MTQTLVRTQDNTRDVVLTIALDVLNAEARAIRRTGLGGTASAAYELRHDHINAVLDAWCDAVGA